MNLLIFLSVVKGHKSRVQKRISNSISYQNAEKFDSHIVFSFLKRNRCRYMVSEIINSMFL